MITDRRMHDNLRTFLAGPGVSDEALLAEVSDAFGEPLLVVASGSVLHGFGNAASDVDLHVVVDAQVTDFPISSHGLGVAVDVTYVEAEWVRTASAVLREGGEERADSASWRAARSRLLRLARLTFGAALAGTGPWRDWQAGMRPQVVDYARDWWRGETLRCRTAARLLAPARPMAAAVRWCDAATAALDVVATEAGQTYVGPKWLGLKLERLGRADLVAEYAALMDLPLREREVAAYRDRAEGLITRLTAHRPLPDDPLVTVRLAEGTSTWRVHDRALVQRWGLRGVELAAADPAADPNLSWSGRVSAVTPDLRRLIEQDLVWLSVHEEGRDGGA
ncbi:hypothetical protein KIH74_13980 [Kineosporia sp. J2-2]|uniref:Nucleotidyltransferase-like protein n=1 Tax=Kineosporia corallincola TaxID=2835133 RepID=A0ABS5TG23_9ACTN|nr:hypothetical protein [Kineosporia corallincola]MBT0770043.1 hypothetical protein [Kineosporia corallincola]